ncbi:hypothetical protein MXD81_41565 [Microbacteriaceae bacterium K1510]|nr:hypothetical protein [Microbacteriaceae bacterium K1510]
MILGTNDIASAVAVHLFRGGRYVVLSHDPAPPVIRRKMAFHDALFDDEIMLDGVIGRRADTSLNIRRGLRAGPGVAVTELGLLDLIVIRSLDVLVDARMQKYHAVPDLRRLARLTIGLGPGFAGGVNCDVAIETHPTKQGRIIHDGPTDAADGTPSLLGGRREERFVRAEVPGRWHTAVEIGTRVYKDFVVGHLGNAPIRAPFDGVLRGIVRDNTEVPAGVKLLEVDPRGRRARWTGIDTRADTIAKAAVKAVTLSATETLQPAAAMLHMTR